MYVIQLDASEREYLISMLKTRRGPVALRLAERIKDSDEVFGLAMWTDSDIAVQFEEHALATTVENLEAVRSSYSAQHIGDLMIECGWSVLDQAVDTLIQEGQLSNTQTEIPR